VTVKAEVILPYLGDYSGGADKSLLCVASAFSIVGIIHSRYSFRYTSSHFQILHNPVTLLREQVLTKNKSGE
jgi:hypothetical protein